MRSESSENGIPSLAGDGDAQRTWQSEYTRFENFSLLQEILQHARLQGHATLVIPYMAFFSVPLLLTMGGNGILSESGRFQTDFPYEKPAQKDENRFKKRQKRPNHTLKLRKNSNRFALVITTSYGGGNR